MRMIMIYDVIMIYDGDNEDGFIRKNQIRWSFRGYLCLLKLYIRLFHASHSYHQALSNLISSP